VPGELLQTAREGRRLGQGALVGRRVAFTIGGDRNGSTWGAHPGLPNACGVGFQRADRESSIFRPSLRIVTLNPFRTPHRPPRSMRRAEFVG
jgi:hypothetical protein